MKKMLGLTPEALRDVLIRRSELRQEHEQLKYFAGTWKHKIRIWLGGTKKNPIEGTGTTVAEPMHDGRHYLLRHSGQLPGMTFSSGSTIGFDNLREEFVTSSTDSMSTGVFLGHGHFDANDKAYTWYGEVQSLRNPASSIRVRLVRRVRDDNHYQMEWYEMHRGKEIQTMQVDFTRD